MSKSKYPNKIDTSIELPYVRNNILQMGSEAINSLRSAVINIEKTLGINPQGSPSQTLSNRLDRSLDESGNIKPSAISNLGLLSGPITDKDISDNANIKESKVELDYPTALLYSEISGLFGEIKSILSQLIEINRTLSTHVSEEAINRHLAKAIKLEQIFSVASDQSVKSLDEQTIQSALLQIVSGHINYTGQNISSSNNSHLANQIYFDNSNTTLENNNLQSVIEELDSFTDTTVKDHQEIFHGNSILSSDYINKSVDENIFSGEASGNKYSTNSDDQFSTFVINSTSLDASKSDLLKANVSGQDRVFQINKTESDLSSTSIEVFGNITSDFSSIINIDKKEKEVLPPHSLNLSFINNPVNTSRNIVEVISPNSSYIISEGLNYSAVSSSSSNLTITIDSIEYNISCHLPSVSSQTPYSISEAINERASESNALFASTVIYINGRYELVIYCRVPNTSEKTFNVTLSRGSDDGIDSLGFSKYEGIQRSGIISGSYVINGVKKSSFNKKLNTQNLSITPNSNVIESSAQDLTLLGIKINDVLHIYNSSSNSGSYIVKTVSSNRITLDTSVNFSEESGTPNFLIINNTCSLSSENFKKTSGTYRSLVGDVFLDRNNELFFDTRMEYSTYVVSSDSILKITDFEGLVQEASLHVDKIDSNTIKIYIDDISYELTDVSNFNLQVRSSKKDFSLSLWIPSSSSIINYIDSTASNLTLNIFMNDSVSEDTNLIIGRLNYNNFSGRFSGDEDVYSKSLVEKGSVTYKNVSSKYEEVYINKRFNETRSSGVATGCLPHSISLNSDTTFSFEISEGVCYISGKRYHIASGQILSDIELSSNDKLFIYISNKGIVRLEPASYDADGCYFSRNSYDNLVIGTIEYDGVSAEIYDLRINISDLDKKSIGPLTVSSEPGFGHFSDIGEALKAAKRFGEVYRSMESIDILIRSGHHVLNVDTGLEFPSLNVPEFDSSFVDQTLISNLAKAGLWIDFPVRIIGEGESSKLEIVFNYSNLEGWSNTNLSDRMIAKKGFLAIGGTNLETLPSTPGYTKLETGKVIFENLNLLNTSVVLYDTDVLVSGDELTSAVIEFYKCNFHQNLIDVSRYSYRPSIIYNRQNSASGFIGGLKVSDCYFKDSNIAFRSPSNSTFYEESDRMMLFDIYNNTIYASGADSFLETTGVLSKIDEKTDLFSSRIFNNSFVANSGKLTSQSEFFNSTIPSGLNIHGDIKVGNISNSSSPNSQESEFYTNVKLMEGNNLTLESGNVILNSGSLNSADITADSISANSATISGLISGTASISGILTASSISCPTISSLGQVSITSNLRVSNDLTVLGRVNAPYRVSYRGRVSVVTGGSGTYFAPVRWDSFQDTPRWGESSLTSAFSNILSTDVLTIPAFSRVVSVQLKSLESSARFQTISLYSLPDGLDHQVEGNYDLEKDFSFTAEAYSTRILEESIVGDFTMTQGKCLVVMLGSLNAGDTFVVNITLELDTPITLTPVL
jgi:hypothetical protein